jgi:hypothetical protein
MLAARPRITSATMWARADTMKTGRRPTTSASPPVGCSRTATVIDETAPMKATSASVKPRSRRSSTIGTIISPTGSHCRNDSSV